MCTQYIAHNNTIGLGAISQCESGSLGLVWGKGQQFLGVLRPNKLYWEQRTQDSVSRVLLFGACVTLRGKEN